MTVREPSTICGHDAVDPSGLAPDSGGQMHEIGSCTACGVRVARSSPLDGWTPAEEED